MLHPRSQYQRQGVEELVPGFWCVERSPRPGSRRNTLAIFLTEYIIVRAAGLHKDHQEPVFVITEQAGGKRLHVYAQPMLTLQTSFVVDTVARTRQGQVYIPD